MKQTERRIVDKNGDVSDNIIANEKGRFPRNINVDYNLIDDDLAKEIIRFTKQNDIDLIFIGARDLRGIRKLTMGSLN